jgi:hypothetical protein
MEVQNSQKKLIYFTLGNNKNYLKLASLCIDSLYKTNYDGDFLFITNFKEIILNSISFKKEPFFLNVDESNLLDSSANKLKVYQFQNINDYDKIIFSDLDILWLSNPDILFNEIIEDKFYVSNELLLMSHEYWGGDILSENEKLIINNNNIKGINAGLFGFNKKMINHLKKIEEFLTQNKHLVNVCLEQPFVNVYLFRNDLYSNVLTKNVSHDGNLETYDGVALHFAGGIGNPEHKYNKMIKYINNNGNI